MAWWPKRWTASVVVLLVALGAVGLAVDTLQGAIGVIPTQIVTWVVFLAALYTAYALVRSVVK